MRRTLSGVAIVVMLVASSTAQDQVSDQPGKLKPVGGMAFSDELEVTVVNLNVHVTDRDGNSVTSLKREDFRVLQDGQERQVTNFELYTEDRIRSQMARVQPGTLPVPTPAA